MLLSKLTKEQAPTFFRAQKEGFTCISSSDIDQLTCSGCLDVYVFKDIKDFFECVCPWLLPELGSWCS